MLIFDYKYEGDLHGGLIFAAFTAMSHFLQFHLSGLDCMRLPINIESFSILDFNKVHKVSFDLSPAPPSFALLFDHAHGMGPMEIIILFFVMVQYELTIVIDCSISSYKV